MRTASPRSIDGELTMTVANWFSGIIGLIMVFVFLGKYAVSINSVPLWIIIVIFGLLMPVADFVKTMREESGPNGETNDT